MTTKVQGWKAVEQAMTDLEHPYSVPMYSEGVYVGAVDPGRTITMLVGQIDPSTTIAVELPDGRKMSRTIGEFVSLLDDAGAFARSITRMDFAQSVARRDEEERRRALGPIAFDREVSKDAAKVAARSAEIFGHNMRDLVAELRDAQAEDDDEIFTRIGRDLIRTFDRGNVSDAAVEKFCAALEMADRAADIVSGYEARRDEEAQQKRIAALKKRLNEPQFRALLRPWSRLVELGEITAADAFDLGEAAALGVDR